MTRRGRRTAAVLLLVFLLVPIAEIFVLIQVGQVIGPWWTIALLIADSVLGTWLIKREGRRAWEALRGRVDAGRLPTRELADGALIVLGGALMLSPGFVTDVFGILLILPVTRPLFRGLLTSFAVGQVDRRFAAPHVPPRGSHPRNDDRPGPQVVRGEVIDDADQ